MRKALSVAIISGLFIISCQNADSSVENISFDSSVVTHPKTVSAPVVIKDSALPVLNTTATPAANATTPVAVGMNPPHGQPGHRCDIAVGAPLNSAPAQVATTKTTQTITTPQPVVLNTNTAPVKTAPGMNPPHGQPGHRCDIAVGAPLNSAPTKPVVKTEENKVASPTPVKADTVSKQ